MESHTTKRLIITHALFNGEVLRREVEDLGFPVVSTEKLHIESSGTFDDTIKLNAYLRNAHRVLYHLEDLPANSLNDLYSGIKKLNWEKIIPVDGYFSIHSSVNQAGIKDFRIVNLKVKDAIADRFLEKMGRRPNSGNQQDKLVLFVYWNENTIQVYIDTSGESLSKHGYRKYSWKAPLSEALASSIIDSTQWDQRTPFINPMCGSGTLAIEAAMKATYRYPGLYRDNYSFLHVIDPPKRRWLELKKSLEEKIKNPGSLLIHASDIQKNAISQARMNAERAGVDRYIRFETVDFRKIRLPEPPGVIVLNPEYGSRLGEEEKLTPLYRDIGDFFKKYGQGYTGYVFSGNATLSKYVGLRTRRKIPFMNGNIECRLLEYELYAGSKKGKKLPK